MTARLFCSPLALSAWVSLNSAVASAQNTSLVRGIVTSSVSGAPVRSASILVRGSGKQVLTNFDGRYELQLGPGRYDLTVIAIGFRPASHRLTVVESIAAIQDFSLLPVAMPLQEVVTIGTRTAGRTATESPAPIDVVTASDIEAFGLPETWQVLQRLIPSLNVPHIPRGDTHLRPVTLRGLSPSQVLVLVNGKRRHSSSVILGGPVISGVTPVDLNTIPVAAIERIEILRDGAAAQYGSDAIAGVVNVVLKSGSRKEAASSVGQAYSSEGGRDWRDGDLFSASATVGSRLGQRGTVTASIEVRNREKTNRAYPDLRTQYFAGDPRNDNPKRIRSHEGDGSAHDRGFMINSVLPAFERLEFYLFGGAMFRDANSNISLYRRALDNTTVRAIHPDGYLPNTDDETRDYSVTLGSRTTFNAWRLDVSSTLGGNSVRYSVHNSNNVSLGISSPTDFYAGKLSSGEWTANLDLSRSLILSHALPIDMSLGAQLRRDGYRIQAGEPDSYRDGGQRILDGVSAGALPSIGSQGTRGFRPADELIEHRTGAAAYADFESHVSNTLLFGVAGRTERYSDYGTTTNGKVTARYEPFRGMAVRGAAATGFRAPSLSQEYFTTTRGILRSVAGATTQLLVRTLPVRTSEAKLLGAKPLEAETSVNVSTGVVIDVGSFPVITIDYYAIDLKDRIVLTNEFLGPAVENLFAQSGLRGIAGGQYFANAIDTRTRGVDIVANHAVPLGNAGMLILTAGYNQTRTRVTHIDSLADTTFQSFLFNRMQRGAVEEGQPGRTLTLTTAYSGKRIGINLHNQRFGEASLLDRTQPAFDQVVRAKWITDISLSYVVVRKISASVSLSNVFDVYPDEWIDFKDGVNATGMSSNGNFRYPGGISPFGMNGRMVYFSLRYR